MDQKEKAIRLHREWNGKLETTSKAPVKDREALAIAYTPGVAEPCKIIAEQPQEVYNYTIKANTVAVVSDGSAVLGLGNIGAYAAMPVMEGKCVLFKAMFYTGDKTLFDPIYAGIEVDYSSNLTKALRNAVSKGEDFSAGVNAIYNEVYNNMIAIYG